MKVLNTLLALIITGMTMAQQAEITYGFDGFETWESAEAGELPEYWDGFNKEVIFNGMSVGSIVTVEKSDVDPYEGSYSAKITNTSIMGGPAVPGILTVGDFIVDWNAQDGDITGGEAYTQLPTVLSGHFKYNPMSPDTGFVSVWFFENGVEVGRGRYDFDQAAMDWTEFNVAINYDAGAAPDSMNMMFASSNAESMVPDGSSLEIDAISFQSYLSVNELNTMDLHVYPNPVVNALSVDFDEITRGTVQLVNSLGMIVKNESFEGKALALQVRDLPVGMYQLVVRAEGTIHTETIVID